MAAAPVTARGQATPRTPVRPQTTVSKEDPTKGRVLSEYFDERTGRAVIVKGDTSQDAALAWLAKVTNTDDAGWEQALGSTLTDGASAGLVAATGVWGERTRHRIVGAHAAS